MMTPKTNQQNRMENIFIKIKLSNVELKKFDEGDHSM